MFWLQIYIIFLKVQKKFGLFEKMLYICYVINFCCIMKVELTILEEHAVRVALCRAIEREKRFQENNPDAVAQFDRNYLEALISVHSKLNFHTDVY